jgi:hypothetical protein
MNSRRLIRFDHYVGKGQQCRRDGQVQQTGGFQIDVQLELRGLLDWNVGWAGPFDDFVDLRGGRSKHGQTIGVEGHPSLGDNRLHYKLARRQTGCEREIDSICGLIDALVPREDRR